MILRVREYLLTPEAAAAMDAPGTTDAAVLVPLLPDPLTAVFTERRADLRRHAGEISFPGGRQDEPGEDLRLTALREAEEEIGLPPDAVEIVGALPPVGTFVTGYRVFPFVGTIERGHLYVRHTLIYAREVDVTIRCLRCDAIYQALVAIHRKANEEARQERYASRKPGYFDQKLSAEQHRLLNHESDWPDIALNCGHEFKERWGVEPPPDLARLAFLTPAEVQAEALVKMTAVASV